METQQRLQPTWAPYFLFFSDFIVLIIRVGVCESQKNIECVINIKWYVCVRARLQVCICVDVCASTIRYRYILRWWYVRQNSIVIVLDFFSFNLISIFHSFATLVLFRAAATIAANAVAACVFVMLFCIFYRSNCVCARGFLHTPNCSARSASTRKPLSIRILFRSFV